MSLVTNDDEEFEPDHPTMTMESWNLRVDIECNLPGPMLSMAENMALSGLLEAAEEVGLMLFENHDPEGYAAWREKCPDARRPVAHVVNSSGAKVIPIRRENIE